MMKTYDSFTSYNTCIYNRFVDCDMHIGCKTCGWNPEEAERRSYDRKFRKENVPDEADGKDT